MPPPRTSDRVLVLADPCARGGGRREDWRRAFGPRVGPGPAPRRPQPSRWSVGETRTSRGGTPAPRRSPAGPRERIAGTWAADAAGAARRGSHLAQAVAHIRQVPMNDTLVRVGVGNAQGDGSRARRGAVQLLHLHLNRLGHRGGANLREEDAGASSRRAGLPSSRWPRNEARGQARALRDRLADATATITSIGTRGHRRNAPGRTPSSRRPAPPARAGRTTPRTCPASSTASAQRLTRPLYVSLSPPCPPSARSARDQRVKPRNAAVVTRTISAAGAVLPADPRKPGSSVCPCQSKGLPAHTQPTISQDWPTQRLDGKECGPVCPGSKGTSPGTE